MIIERMEEVKIVHNCWILNSEYSMLNNNMNDKRRTAHLRCFVCFDFIHLLRIEHWTWMCLSSVLAGMRIESCEICYVWITNFIFTVFLFLFRFLRIFFLLFYFSDKELIIINETNSDVFALTGNFEIFLHLFFLSFQSKKKKIIWEMYPIVSNSIQGANSMMTSLRRNNLR